MGKRPPPGPAGRAARGEPREGRSAPRAAVPPRARQEKKKTNSKPKHLDEQEIPYRLRELIKSREEMKNPKSRKRRKAVSKRKPVTPDPAAQGDIPVPKFKRWKQESVSAYIQRMEQETQHVLFLTKNQLQREPETEEPAPEKSQRKKEFQNKRLEKMQKKREEKKAAMLEKALFQDPVQFGEVAMQPPALTVKPRKGVIKEKAGPRQLLLTALLAPGHVAPARKAAPLSLARQRIVEEERERVIQAYRDIKKRRQQQAPESCLVGDKLEKPL
ncbi:coiled-coil domain-containing protein 137 isoform X2 [Dermochelys coriacea]|uniref:coiled-coil domain-containing protein 137 isoform X2 n=1 Tax=Dermochelys coriacea TaxID=27794 RepID=UPI0018E85523|nr:coiled-coil domain-containing protein 137 isoform X2 [Dermochelys coriacea]